jgi:hypothetical protein
MQEIQSGGEKSFIGAWFIPDLGICDDLIQFFKDHDDKVEGQVGDSGKVDKALKDSVDVIIPPGNFAEPIVARYLANLNLVVDEYVKKFRASSLVDRWGVTENINIQWYRPMGGYKEWHTERYGKSLPSCHRHLVFMTYLNDVFDEGGTEFYHQKVRVSPRKGLSLIWPADWTHLHRGVVSPTEEKYIITGWLSFI